MLASFKEHAEASSDSGPSKVGSVDGTTAGGKIHAIGSIREDSDKGGIKIFRLIWGDEDHASISNGHCSFGAGIGDNRKATRKVGNSTAAARRDWAANKEKNVACGEFLNDLRGFYDSFHRKLHGQVTEPLSELGFTEFSMPPEDREAKPTKILGGVAETAARIICVSRAPALPPVMLNTAIVGVSAASHRLCSRLSATQQA